MSEWDSIIAEIHRRADKEPGGDFTVTICREDYERAAAVPPPVAQEGLRAIVDQQAEDEGLWFVAQTAPEAYLQQELRRLHAAVEAAPPVAQEPVAWCIDANDGDAPKYTAMRPKAEGWPTGTTFIPLYLHPPAVAQEARDAALEAEIARLNAIINEPHADDFIKAVSIEAEHQRQRWPSDHDAGKTPADWFWLIGYLAGKALHSHAAGNTEKAEHHVITTAAACLNWHRAIFGRTNMRPGHEEGTFPDDALKEQP